MKEQLACWHSLAPDTVACWEMLSSVCVCTMCVKSVEHKQMVKMLLASPAVSLTSTSPNPTHHPFPSPSYLPLFLSFSLYLSLRRSFFFFINFLPLPFFPFDTVKKEELIAYLATNASLFPPNPLSLSPPPLGACYGVAHANDR